MKAVVWNVRGLNMKEKHKELRKGGYPSPTQGIFKMGAVETKVRESRTKRIIQRIWRDCHYETKNDNTKQGRI